MEWIRFVFRKSSWKAALIPFGLGPMALSTMYLYYVITDSPAVSQRGLFHFNSATFGDFLLLPLTWILMAKSHSLNKFNARKSMFFSLLIICISILISGGLTYLSMQGDKRDWTLPTPGTVNYPGIYHSIFMAFMFSVYLFYVFEHWEAIFNSKQDSEAFISLSTIYWYVLDILTLFMSLLWIDDLYNGSASTFISFTPQQIGWGVCLITNIILTIKSGYYPYKNMHIWLFKQSVVYFIIILFGNFLSRNPILW